MPASRPQFDLLEMDRLERPLVSLPLLLDPASYVPDTVDLTDDALARKYWLGCFEEALDGVRRSAGWVAAKARPQAVTGEGAPGARPLRAGRFLLGSSGSWFAGTVSWDEASWGSWFTNPGWPLRFLRRHRATGPPRPLGPWVCFLGGSLLPDPTALRTVPASWPLGAEPMARPEPGPAAGTRSRRQRPPGGPAGPRPRVGLRALLTPGLGRW